MSSVPLPSPPSPAAEPLSYTSDRVHLERIYTDLTEVSARLARTAEDAFQVQRRSLYLLVGLMTGFGAALLALEASSWVDPEFYGFAGLTVLLGAITTLLVRGWSAPSTLKDGTYGTVEAPTLTGLLLHVQAGGDRIHAARRRLRAVDATLLLFAASVWIPLVLLRLVIVQFSVNTDWLDGAPVGALTNVAVMIGVLIVSLAAVVGAMVLSERTETLLKRQEARLRDLASQVAVLEAGFWPQFGGLPA